MKKINVLFASAELAPYAKVGGLADVAGALPVSLSKNFPDQLDIRIIIPFHAAVKQAKPKTKKLGKFSFKANTQTLDCELFVTDLDGVPVYLIDNEYINHNSPIYQGDWQLDGMKYASFSLALLEAARFIDWKIDILHANDWHTALSVYALTDIYKDDRFFSGIKTILSIHNLPFNGWGSQDAMSVLGFTPSKIADLPYWAKFTPLPMGIAAADKVIAVSPNYAKEILTPEFGCGIENYLNLHSDKVMGILNGIDEIRWDPNFDKSIAHNFSSASLPERVKNKLDLQASLGFEQNPDIPLLTVVSRLSYQKGINAILEALPQMLDMSWQFVLLGTGDQELEKEAARLAKKHPKRIASIIKFDDAIARTLYASGDLFLMPSEYEPCGLSQMFAMRYGNLPIATATGGLSDSIQDYSLNPKAASGFLYTNKTTKGLLGALKQALALKQNKKEWHKLQLNAMNIDFSWTKSAKQYLAVYKSLKGKHDD